MGHRGDPKRRPQLRQTAEAIKAMHALDEEFGDLTLFTETAGMTAGDRAYVEGLVEEDW